MGKLGAVIFTVCLSALYAVIIRTAAVCLKKTDERAFGDTLGPKISIVLSNLVMAGIEVVLLIIFIFTAEGSNGSLFYPATEMYASGFFWRMLLLAVIYCMPMINLLLYRLCYIKTGISRRWVIVPFTLIFGAVSFLMLLELYFNSGGTVGHFGNTICFLPVIFTVIIFSLHFFKIRWYHLAAAYFVLHIIAKFLSGASLAYEVNVIAVNAAVAASLSYIPFFKKDIWRLAMVMPVFLLIEGLIFIFTYGEYDWGVIINWIEIEWILR